MISTTCDLDIAKIFATNSNNIVIFEIHISRENNPNLCLFANISNYTAYPDENASLIFLGATFRIDSIEKESDSIRRVKLILTNEHAQSVYHKYIIYIQQDLIHLCLKNIIDI